MAGRKALWTVPTIDLHPPPLKPNLLDSPHPQISSTPATKSPPLPNLLLSFLSHTIEPIITKFTTPTQKTPQKSKTTVRESGCSLPLFRPYVAKVPWHGGVRGFLSQLFPRYGHYCGPNWSSGKNGGSMLWDQRPIDWLDFCCYCHDIGYDTHDQAKLLKADLAFLECLERPRMATKGGAHLAFLYRSMCITGLRHLLIPYRMQLLRMHSSPPSFFQLLAGLRAEKWVSLYYCIQCLVHEHILKTTTRNKPADELTKQ